MPAEPACTQRRTIGYIRLTRAYADTGRSGSHLRRVRQATKRRAPGRKRQRASLAAFHAPRRSNVTGTALMPVALAGHSPARSPAHPQSNPQQERLPQSKPIRTGAIEGTIRDPSGQAVVGAASFAAQHRYRRDAAANRNSRRRLSRARSAAGALRAEDYARRLHFLHGIRHQRGPRPGARSRHQARANFDRHSAAATRPGNAAGESFRGAAFSRTTISGRSAISRRGAAA